jgi:hypothetical protein
VNTTFFSEMLQSIADRSRALIKRERREPAHERSAGLVEQCEELLSGRGEASGVALAQEILADSPPPSVTIAPASTAPSRTGVNRRPTQPRRIFTWPASRGGSNCSVGLISPRAAPLRWFACARNCSMPWIAAMISA